jgi:hypothetical protein
MNVIAGKKIGRLVLGLALLPLGACASAFAPKTESQSALAPEIEQLVAANRRYPRWADFPKTPRDLPSPETVRADVDGLSARSSALSAETARIAWTLDDAEAFAQDVTRRVESQRPAAPTLQTEADIEAFGQRLRDRAAAPPPIDRFRRPPN